MRHPQGGSLLVSDNVITRVGPTAELAGAGADRVLDLSGYIVMPGMVNTHHHIYQNLTRVMVQDDDLFVWLTTLPDLGGARRGDLCERPRAMVELIRSGCTTSSDHLYVLPNNCRLDSEILAAQETGMRFHAAPCRAARARAGCCRTVAWSRKTPS